MRRGQAIPEAWVLGLSAAAAAALFAAVFRIGQTGPVDFWWRMALGVAVLSGTALAADPDYMKRLRRDAGASLPAKLALGVLSAAVLYAVFAAGRIIAVRLLPAAAADIADVYRLKQGTGLLCLILLLGLLIGPGEEVFWRGFLQERASARFGRNAGFGLTALLYAGVHVATGNIMLILAAAVCGAFWGLTYRLFRSPILNAVSHAVWDIAIFIVRPL